MVAVKGPTWCGGKGRSVRLASCPTAFQQLRPKSRAAALHTFLFLFLNISGSI